MKRLISWLLALTLIFGLMPLSAFAVEVESGEDKPDVEVGFEELLQGYTAENPIDLTNDLRDATETVVVPAGKTMYFIAYGIAGMEMTINDGEAVLCAGNPRVAYAWSITNDGAEDAEYTIKVGYPAGSMDNPATLTLGENNATVAADARGYFYTYTAEQTGTLVLEFASSVGGWTYAVNNLTTYAYGDTQWSDSDPVVNPAEVEVTEGDELQIMVCTYDAANPWNAPAGTVTVNASYKAEEPECEYVDTNLDGRCDNCGEEKLDDSLAFYAKSMVLGADIRGIFQVRKIKATSPYESFKVIVEKNGVETELELVATSDKTNHTTYGYALTVAAKEMADVVNARIIGITADGEAFISNPVAWSIKEGAIAIMDTYASKTDDASKNKMELAANMLNYGTMAQNYFSYNLDNLATDGLSEEYAAYIITETPEMETIAKTDNTGATAPLKDIVFNLAARVQVLPRFTVPKADAKEIYKAVITQIHVSPDGTEKVYDTVTIDGSNCLKSGSTLAVYIDYLAANELRDVMTITLYKNDEIVSATHTFSAESVLCGLKSSSPTLVTALMNYGDCARAVFG